MKSGGVGKNIAPFTNQARSSNELHSFVAVGRNRLGNDTAIVRNPTIVQNRYDRGAIGYARPETRADARGCN